MKRNALPLLSSDEEVDPRLAEFVELFGQLLAGDYLRNPQPPHASDREAG